MELGCGISALPACSAALQGPRLVLATDGNADTLPNAASNARRWASAHPHAAPIRVAQLRWGDGSESAVLQSAGVTAPVDVILAADTIYVLDNPGGWGKFLSTVLALSAPHALILITYTDRGHHKTWTRFLAQRVEAFFHVTEVAPHLLHPYAHPGTPGRLEQLTPSVRIYCWARKQEAAAAILP